MGISINYDGSGINVAQNLILHEPGHPKDKNGLLCLAEKLLPERQHISGDGITKCRTLPLHLCLAEDFCIQ